MFFARDETAEIIIVILQFFFTEETVQFFIAQRGEFRLRKGGGGRKGDVERHGPRLHCGIFCNASIFIVAHMRIQIQSFQQCARLFLRFEKFRKFFRIAEFAFKDGKIHLILRLFIADFPRLVGRKYVTHFPFVRIGHKFPFHENS